jgi:hypothetical protein
MPDIKHGAVWFGYDEGKGAALVSERVDPDASFLTAVFQKRGLYFVRVFFRTTSNDPTGTYIDYEYWAGGTASWFETFDEAVAEASRLFNTRGA